MISKIFLYCALCTLLLAQTARSLEIYRKSYPPVRGAQVFVITPEYRGKLSLFFSELKGAGVNTVFLRVFHNSRDGVHLGLENGCGERGGLYFKSNYACTVYDILPEAIKAARENDIKLYAWMATRSLSFLKTADNMSATFLSMTDTGLGYGANLFKPQIRSALKELFLELAAYDIDGILVQDDFIIKYNEGADEPACEAFVRSTGNACNARAFFEEGQRGTLGKPSELYKVWADWKAQELAALFKEIRLAARLVNPQLYWAVNIYYETPIYEDKGLAWYSHDLRKLAAAGADYFAVMAYYDQISRELHMSFGEVLKLLGELSSSAIKPLGAKRTLMKTQVKSFNGLTALPLEEIQKVKEALAAGGAVNFVTLPINKPTEVR